MAGTPAKWAKTRREFLKGKADYRDMYQCHYCAQYTANPDVDHVQGRGSHPERKYDLSNLVIACRPCHIIKTNHGGI